MSSHDLILGLDFAGWQPGGAIIEVGTQRKGGTGSSTDLLDLAGRLGVDFATVDFSEATHRSVQRSAAAAHAHLADGATFLRTYPGAISILYLDNYDIGYSDEHFANLKGRIGTLYRDKGFDDSAVVVQNMTSATVHLDQTLAALPKLTPRCVVGIDDTFHSDEARCWLGKGTLVVPYLVTSGFRIAASHAQGLVLTRGWPAP